MLHDDRKNEFEPTKAIYQNAMVTAIADETRAYVLKRLAENDDESFRTALNIAKKDKATAASLKTHVQYSDNTANSHKVFWLLKIYAIAEEYLKCGALDIQKRSELWKTLVNEVENADSDLVKNYLNYLGRDFLNDIKPPKEYVDTLTAISMQANIDLNHKKYEKKFLAHKEAAQTLVNDTEIKNASENRNFILSVLDSKSAQTISDERFFELACHVDPKSSTFKKMKNRNPVNEKLSQALSIIDAIHNYKLAVKEYNDTKSDDSISSMKECVKELSGLASKAANDPEIMKFYKIAFNVNDDFIKSRLHQFIKSLRTADDRLKSNNQEGISAREAQGLVDRVTISTSSNIGTRGIAYSVKASAISKETSIEIGTHLLHALLAINPTLAEESIKNLIDIQDKDTTFNFFRELPSSSAKFEFVRILFEYDYNLLTKNKKIKQKDINQYISALANSDPAKSFNLFNQYKDSDTKKSEAIAIAILNNRQMREWLFSQGNRKESYQSLIRAIQNQIGDEKTAPHPELNATFNKWTSTDFQTALELSETKEDEHFIRWAMMTNEAVVSEMKHSDFKEISWNYLSDAHIRQIPKVNRIAYLRSFEELGEEKEADIRETMWNGLKMALGQGDELYSQQLFKNRVSALTHDIDPKDIANETAPILLQLLKLNVSNINTIIEQILAGADKPEKNTKMKMWSILKFLENSEELLNETEIKEIEKALDKTNIVSQLRAYFGDDTQRKYIDQLILFGLCQYEKSDSYKPMITPFIRNIFLKNPEFYISKMTFPALEIIKSDHEIMEVFKNISDKDNPIVIRSKVLYEASSDDIDKQEDAARFLGQTTFSNTGMLNKFLIKHANHTPTDSGIKMVFSGILWGAALGIITFLGAKLIAHFLPDASSFINSFISSSSAMTSMVTPILSGIAMTAGILTGAGLAAATAYALAPFLAAALVGAVVGLIYQGVKYRARHSETLNKASEAANKVGNAIISIAVNTSNDKLDYARLVKGLEYSSQYSKAEMVSFLKDPRKKEQRKNLASTILYFKDQGHDIFKEHNISPSTQRIMKLLCDQYYYEKNPIWRFIVNTVYFVPYAVLSIVTLGNASRILTPPWSLSSKVESAIKSDQENRQKAIESKHNNVEETINPTDSKLQQLFNKREKRSASEIKRTTGSPSSPPVIPAVPPSPSSPSLPSVTRPPALFIAPSQQENTKMKPPTTTQKRSNSPTNEKK